MIAAKTHNTNISDLLMQFRKDPNDPSIKFYNFHSQCKIWAAVQKEHDLHREPQQIVSQKVPSKPDAPLPADTNMEIEKLKNYLMALKKPKAEFSFCDLGDYKSVNLPNKGKIGNGAQSNVYKVYKDERKFYAKKEFNVETFSPKEFQRFFQESEILFILRHPCIVRFYDFNNGDDEHPPIMILSLEKESLEDAIQNNSLSNEQKSLIAVEIVLGMRFVHNKNFMHRDLKPSNILLSDSGHVKISDFGLARDDSLKESQTKGIGTIRFMAPELLQEGDGDLVYDKSIDVYAFGIILYFIVCGDFPPFNLIKIAKRIMPDMPKSMVNWVQKLINSCFSFAPNERPTFADIFQIMKANKYNLFSDLSEDEKVNAKKTASEILIEKRIAKIEAFEYQHQDD